MEVDKLSETTEVAAKHRSAEHVARPIASTVTTVTKYTAQQHN